MGHHRQIIDRYDGRRLSLYSKEPRYYHHFDGLPAVNSVSPHLRRHPLTGDWIGIAAARQQRTFLPNHAECPFCVMHDGGPLTDIPVDAYEVAVFTNRFAFVDTSPTKYILLVSPCHPSFKAVTSTLTISPSLKNLSFGMP